MSTEVPTPKNAPRKLEEPYEWSNGWFPRPPMNELRDTDGSQRSMQDKLHMAAEHRDVPHPNIAARMKTLAGKSIADVMADTEYYPFDNVELSDEQMDEELELIAGKTDEGEGLPKLGGAIKEIDDTHEAIANAPTPSWIKRFKAFMLESQQNTPEFRMRKLQRDRKYLVQRAMILLEINPRIYEEPDDQVLATLIAARQANPRSS